MKRTSLVYDDVARLQDLADSVILLQVHYTRHVLGMPATEGSWLLRAANHLDTQMERLLDARSPAQSYTVQGHRGGTQVSTHTVAACTVLEACLYAERADAGQVTADEYRVVHISPASDASAPVETRLDSRR